MLSSFSQKTIEELNYYVYVYSDPDTHKPFYVGKGKGNRVFNHLTDDNILFSSSSAADFILGYSVSGPRTWKAKDGRSLKEVEECQTD